jgi:fucose permease
MYLALGAYLAFFSIALPDSTLGVAWPSMRVAFDQPTSAAGLVPPVGVAATLVSTSMSAALAARFGLGRLLAVGTLVSTASLVITAASGSFGQFLVSVALGGFSGGAIDAALNAYAARTFGARRINLMHAWYGIGAAASPLVVVAAVQSGAGWRWAYGAIAALQLVISVIFAVTHRAWGPPGEVERDARPRRSGDPARVRVWTPDAGIGLLAVTLQTGIEASVALWAYTYLVEGARVAPLVAGGLASGYWATLVAGRIVLGPVAERLGAWRVLALALTGMGSAALLLVIGSPVAAVAGTLLFGLAGAPVYPLLILTTAERTSAAAADRVIGYQAGASSVGAAVLPLLVGLALARSASTFAATLAGLCGLALALHVVMRIRRWRGGRGSSAA